MGFLKSGLLCIGLFLQSATAQTTLEILQEAEDYLSVNPQQSLRLLAQVGSTENWPPAQQIRWHMISMRASVPTGQLSLVIDSLDSIFHYHNDPYFKEKIVTVTSALGIWLRKNHYIEEAKLSFKCSFKYAQNDRHKLSLTNSLALLARQQNNLDEAKTLFSQAMPLAKSTGKKNIIAMIENNQGMIALEEGNFQSAERHFREALKGYQNIDKRSGKVSAGINLLFTFLVQDQVVNFERLYEPTLNLANAFDNKAKIALLGWLRTWHLHMQGMPITQAKREQLEAQLKQIDDSKLQHLALNYIAPELGFSLKDEIKHEEKQFQKPWFELVRRCDW